MSLLHPGARLVDARGGALSGGADLAERVDAAAAAYPGFTPGCVLLRMNIDVGSVVRYLGAWRAGRPVALLDPGLAPETLAEFVDRFEPGMVVGLDVPPVPGEQPKGYHLVRHALHGPVWQRDVPSPRQPHPDLGILLPTSGSTGNAKLVRLSRAAILANTASIIEALRIDGDQVAITSLQLFYSFGMSVLNTHLASGATLVLEPDGLLHRPFWDAVDRYGVTSLSGVPYQYEMLHRLRFDPARYPGLRTLTQAGGRLRPEMVLAFHERMAAVGGRMYVMYGQTEAGPRLTTLPAERLPDKIGSAGPAVPGGKLSVRLEDGTETTAAGVIGEILYRGPNVMMGYAQTAADLALGDEQGGLLETGDLGHLDEDGYLFITGRLKRFGKIFGVRVNLADIEAFLSEVGPAAVVSGDDKVVVWLESGADTTAADCAGMLAERLRLHRSGFDVRTIDALPLLGNGKVDYRALERAV